MTPPAATAAARGAVLPRPLTPRAPRRVSGPSARPKHGGAVAVPGYTPLGLRIARRAKGLPDARLLDRLTRGRAWIATIAVALIGLVFLQVSMLKLNAGIGRALTAEQTLQRQNQQLAADVATLDSGARIQKVAQKLGMVMPAAGQYHYVHVRPAQAAVAAHDIRPPAPVTQQAPLEPADPVASAAVGTTAAATPAATTTPAVAPATTTAAPVAAPAAAAPAVAATATATVAAPGTGQ